MNMARPRRIRLDPERVPEAVVKALRHPLRIAIVRRMLDPATPTLTPQEMARESGVSLGVVSYHFRTLAELGLIVVTRQRQVRGAIEHHYALTERDRIGTVLWSLRAELLRRDDAPTDISRGTAVLDREGLDELHRLVAGLLDRVAELERAAHARAEASDERAELVPVALLLTTGGVEWL